MCADAEYCPIIPQGKHGEGVGGERGAGGGHTVVSLSPSRHHCLPRHLNKSKKGYVQGVPEKTLFSVQRPITPV